jgi:RNA binding exosome subunit
MDISSLAFRTFAHATEDETKVIQALKFASGAEEVKSSKTTGFHGNPLLVLEVKVTEGKKIKAFFQSLDKQDVRKLLGTLDKRVDDDSFIFLRLDKQEAYQGRIRMAEHDDVIAVRGKIKSYPRSHENALLAARRYLESLLD